MASDVASALTAQLPFTLSKTDFPALGTKYQGKVRDTYAQGDRLVLITTDRLSAFDHILTTLPFKGDLLNTLAHHWFSTTRHVVANHVLDMPDPCVTVARRANPFPIEFVVRAHLTGSLWRDYEAGRDPYALNLPKGLKKDHAFEAPILTPSTKAQLGAHDEPLSAKQVVERKLASARDWQRASEAALGLFAAGQAQAKAQGLILVDTKYEVGVDPSGELVLIDEIHTPDSSRYWYADGYEGPMARGEDPRSLDKEFLRRWLVSVGFRGEGPPPPLPDEIRVEAARRYIEACERITGLPFAPEDSPPVPRLRRALGL